MCPPAAVWKGALVSGLDTAAVNELHARVCQALADPKRLLILDALRDGPRSVGDLAESLHISQPTVSRHLAVLKDRGMVAARRFGSSVHYSLTSRKIIDAIDLLRQFVAEERGWERDGGRVAGGR
jgi:DNA-binding transcriptional ArsR family regulator